MNVAWQPRALAVLRKLPRDEAQRISTALDTFAETGTGDVAKLAGDPGGRWRLRVGDWRVLFTRAPGTIVVIAVHNRRDAYR